MGHGSGLLSLQASVAVAIFEAMANEELVHGMASGKVISCIPVYICPACHLYTTGLDSCFSACRNGNLSTCMAHRILADRVDDRGRNLETLICVSTARRENSCRIGLVHHIDLVHRIVPVCRIGPCSSTARSHVETAFCHRTGHPLILSVILASPALDLVSVRPRQRHFRCRYRRLRRIHRLRRKYRRPRRLVTASHRGSVRFSASRFLV